MRANPSTPICGPPRKLVAFLVLASCTLLVPAAVAQSWVEFTEETSQRMVAQTGRGADDVREKDFAWGDVDKDGDIDLVVVRKAPFTSPGKDENVLFINEGGVLTDRTSEFAVDSDVVGDEGFLTPTNDRDVVLVDVDNDTWLDIVTAPTISPNDPKHIGHPRVYMNKGCTGGCNTTNDWLGFRFENDRIPTMLSDSGQSGFNPCFCHVAAGDVTGDGYADLWFVDYDSQCTQAGADFNDKLLVNQGESNPGFFTDVTETSFSDNFPVSAFGASGDVRDMNNNGKMDLMKQFAGFVGLAYNEPDNEGFFDQNSSPYGGSAYFASIDDLNNDDLLDIVISDDGQDRYLINQGVSGLVPSFISFVFDYANMSGQPASDDDGFSGNSISADLDKDGFKDVLMTDADVDAGGCTRRMHIFKNLGGEPGSNVTLQEQTLGTGCQSFLGNPSTCIVASIPSNVLEGTHDVAVFDINGDTFLDLVVGRCVGTEVYMNVPTGAPAGGIPNGDGIPGTQLTLGKGQLGQLEMSWGESCGLEDTDYSIYGGRIDTGLFDSHSQIQCSTDGLTSAAVFPEVESTYYLVVPHNEVFEGSYGKSSSGAQRSAGISSCHAQAIAACE